MENFICNQYGERFAILNTETVKICVCIIKLEAIKNAICLRFLPHLQKIWIVNFPRQCSNMPKVRCVMSYEFCSKYFVANFIRFPAVQKFWKSVKIWQNYRQLKGGNFFETQCSLIYATKKLILVRWSRNISKKLCVFWLCW